MIIKFGWDGGLTLSFGRWRFHIRILALAGHEFGGGGGGGDDEGPPVPSGPPPGKKTNIAESVERWLVDRLDSEGEAIGAKGEAEA